MSWNLAKVIIMTAVLVGLGIDWYNDAEVPAWVAFIWAFCVFLDDLAEWLEHRDE